MYTQPPQRGESRSKSSRFAGATSNTSLIGTEQEYRHQLVHHDAANAATKHITQDAHLKMVRKTGSSNDKKQHAVECEYIYIEVNGRQLSVSCTLGMRRELHDKCIAARNGKPPSSTTAYISTLCEIKHHDVVTSGIFAYDFPDKHPREWTKQASITLQEAAEVYIVEVIAESHCYKQQPISCSFSTCLLLWQGKEVGYSWNSATCAWPWMWQKWPKKGVRVSQLRKHDIWWRNLAPRFEKRRSGMFSSLGITRWRLY